jgi:hypothetical protein
VNPFALAGLVCATLAGLALLAIACARVLDAVLDAPQRALLVGVSFAAGFCAGVLAFALCA